MFNINFMEQQENSFNNSERKKERESSKEIKEKEAYREIAKLLQEKLAGEEELLRKHPFFHSQGREWKISGVVDCLQAKGQLELKLVQEILAEIREQEDYWQEKAAAKMVAFFRTQENLFSHYAELKNYYPQMTRIIEEQQMPWLEEIFKKAEKLWDSLNKNNEQ